MKKYKPEVLGKALPDTNRPDKMTDFMHNKYEKFSKIYDVCKSELPNIGDVKTVESSSDNDKSYSMKITADGAVLDKIASNIKDKNDGELTISGDVLTSK